MTSPKTTPLQVAYKLRNNTDAAEYQHFVLGLIVLQCNSDAFEQRHRLFVADS